MYFIALGLTALLETRSTDTPSSFSILSANVTKSRPIDGSTSTRISTSLPACWSPLEYEPNNAILRTLNRFCSSGLSLAKAFRISSFVITTLPSELPILVNTFFAWHYKSYTPSRQFLPIVTFNFSHTPRNLSGLYSPYKSAISLPTPRTSLAKFSKKLTNGSCISDHGL